MILEVYAARFDDLNKDKIETEVYLYNSEFSSHTSPSGNAKAEYAVISESGEIWPSEEDIDEMGYGPSAYYARDMLKQYFPEVNIKRI